MIGTRAGSASDPAEEPPGQQVVLLETNVDDATGETLAHAIEALLEAGAIDAWLAPLVMKKGRPGHLVSVLCDPALAGGLGELLLRETGSLGVRFHDVQRWPASRWMSEVDVDGSPLRVKVSPGRVKVEHADAARLARRTGTPLREIVARAEAAWRASDQRSRGRRFGGLRPRRSLPEEHTTDRRT